MSRDQYTLTDPTTLYDDITTKTQSQAGSGLASDLDQRADHGEDGYRGTGRLPGRRAPITGGDSGTGAAVVCRDIPEQTVNALGELDILVDHATTEASINTFSKALQLFAPKGIRVEVVAPGPIWTPLQTAGGQPPDKLSDVGEQTPLGRAGRHTLHINRGMPTP